ncbi:MAG: serine protein kinase RIO [Propionibacteriaceae bacterium]
MSPKDLSFDPLEDEWFIKNTNRTTQWDEYDPDLNLDGHRWSSWPTLTRLERGPQPYPSWVIEDHGARDEDLGILKSGKEADVFLLRRFIDDREVYLAAKRYRSREHRQFTRDDGYTEGRRVRKSREMRALQRGTNFGRQLAQGLWAAAEWQAMVELWQADFPLPYPMSFDGNELLMEFIDVDGAAAPRLAQTRPSPAVLAHLYEQFRDIVLRLAARGNAHGDLSPYNILVRDDRLIVIDWPQLIDIVANPDGMDYLLRDCTVTAEWFTTRGLAVDGEALFAQAVGQI